MEYLLILFQYAIWRLALKLLKAPFHPVVILCQLWFVVALCTGVFAPDYYYSPSAYLVVICMELSAILGALAYFLIYPGGLHYLASKPSHDFRYFRPIIYGSLIFGLLAIVSILRTQGIGISKLFSFSGIVEISHSMSVARYEDQFKLPLGARLGQMFVFFSSAVAGLMKSLHPKKYKGYEYFVPIIPSLMIALILTTRAAVLFNLCFWVSGNFCGSLLGGGRVNLKLVTKRVLVYGGGGLFFIAFLFISLQFLRGGITDISRLKEVLLHLRQWPVGSIGGLSLWFDTYDFRSALTNGYLTFVGIFDLLGIQARKTGLYDQYVNLGGGDSWANIYTAFRGLIQDFSIFGAIAYMGLIGFFSALSFGKCIQGQIVWAALLVAMYGFIAWSPIVSFFTYTAHIGACMGFAIYLKYFSRTRSVPRVRAQ